MVYNNWVQNHTDNGISFTGSSNVTVSGEDPIQSGNPQKFVQNNSGFGVYFHAAEGTNQNVTLVHIRAINNGYQGVYFQDEQATGVGYGLSSHNEISACLTALNGIPYGPDPSLLPNLTNKAPVVNYGSSCPY
jgi:hypothetical protein